MRFKVILVLIIGLFILGGCEQYEEDREVIPKEIIKNKEITENKKVIENKEIIEDKETTENKKAIEDKEVVENKETERKTKTYSLAEISKHNNEDSCWTIINRKVYNITSHISEHTGGERNIKQGCGIDATDIFVGKPHPERAHNYLRNFYIGDLE